MNTGDQAPQETLLVSRESFARLKLEYRSLVVEKIPANAEAIAAAGRRGDFCEIQEYQKAKSTQKALFHRRDELEALFNRLRVAEPL